MSFSRDGHWVWDFWYARDGDLHHLYYLFAETKLGDPDLRHRNARVGHASSTDLHSWTDHGTVLEPGSSGAADASATWTGSIVRMPDGRWRMFYTGALFPSTDSNANVETIMSATSSDLHSWTKDDWTLSADPRWYEKITDGTWHEEAWRDPWVWRDPDGLWQMYVTSRSNAGPGRDRGVIGHAVSADLTEWRVQPALTCPGAGFAHLEVLQRVEIEGRSVVLFSCDASHLAGARAGVANAGGVWWMPVEDDAIDLAGALRLTSDELYSGRAIQDSEGHWVLLAFENIGTDGRFIGQVTDPLPLRWSADGNLEVLVAEVSR